MAADTRQIAEQFEKALQQMEQSRNVEELAGFFAEDAVLGNLGAAQGLKGPHGAREFWQRYLEQFREIRSEFSHTTAADHALVVEWKSHGTLKDGHPIDYRGVSILRLNEDGRVGEFQSYYDSAAFVTAKGKSA
jgi:ketosteroid isomerase-like protein